MRQLKEQTEHARQLDLDYFSWGMPFKGMRHGSEYDGSAKQSSERHNLKKGKTKKKVVEKKEK